MDKGIFFTFEGCDGSGKSTQAKLLSEWMEQRNIPHILTKEPGSTEIKECVKFRNLVLDPDNDFVPIAELMIFLADRAQHVEKLIKPSLEKGIHVICDRFSDSTKIYQSARGLSRHKIDMMLDFVTDGLIPDMTFLLDIPHNIGLERARGKNKNGDRMENAGSKFHEDVRHGFLKLAESLSEQHRFVVIDVAPPKTIEETQKQIVKHVSTKLWIPGEKND